MKYPSRPHRLGEVRGEGDDRSEEHTSELQSHVNLVCRLLVEKKKGFAMLVFLAGLQNIPVDYYEAAQLDGANRLQLFRHITLPLISPTLFFNLVIYMIGALQV